MSDHCKVLLSSYSSVVHDVLRVIRRRNFALLQRLQPVDHERVFTGPALTIPIFTIPAFTIEALTSDGRIWP